MRGRARGEHDESAVEMDRTLNAFRGDLERAAELLFVDAFENL